MTWVKICGITNLEDALVAVEAGADAVGFVFYEKSPRCVTVESAREIVANLPASVEKVGVFVGPTAEMVIEISHEAQLTAAQVYPDAKGHLLEASDEFLRKAECDLIVALSSRVLESQTGDDPVAFWLSQRTVGRTLAVLVDSGSADRPGGTGEKSNWEHATFIREGMKRIGLPLIVAGGLTADNVQGAVEVFHPWGVDVSSGVEARPGKKDPEKVRAFVRAVREYDATMS